MSLIEKIKAIKSEIFAAIPNEKNLPTTKSNTDIAILEDLDAELDSLAKEDCSLVNMTIKKQKCSISLIVLLDISGSMRGTEEDVYQGLKKLIEDHQGEDILINYFVFNGSRYAIIDDTPIDEVHIGKIDAGGDTNLYGSLYHTVIEKCQSGVNLLVTISDGEEQVFEKSINETYKIMNKYQTDHNHFYFLGEPNSRQTPENVFSIAKSLGFKDENIAIFTRLENGNRLNFSVISKMLDDIIHFGKVSDDWSKPIKEHYLALVDKRQ